MFRKEGVGQSVSGYFTETGMPEMLETADYMQKDLLSLFFGDIVNVCCRNSKKNFDN